MRAQVAGLAGTRQEVRRWLIGCDGSHSAVRHGLGLPFEGEYKELFLIADVHIDWSMPDDEILMELTPEGPLVAIPLPDRGRWRLVDTTGLVDARSPESTVARFRDLLTRYVAPGHRWTSQAGHLRFTSTAGWSTLSAGPLLRRRRRRTPA